MRSSIHRLSLGFTTILAVIAFSGCATKSYVKQKVAPVDSRVIQLSQAQTQQGERIDAVDTRARSASEAAGRAQSEIDASEIQVAVVDRKADTADTKADGAQKDANRAMGRIDVVENRVAALDTFVADPTQTVVFKVNSSTLSKEATGMLDRIAAQAAENNKGYVIEVQGFTDSSGSTHHNLRLSRQRADAVLLYLVDKNIPLHRISIVGHGESSPVAENKTSKGRRDNRRVEVRMLRSKGAQDTQRAAQ